MKLKLLALMMLCLSCDMAFAQRQWEQTNGPYGGYVWSIVTAPDQKIYVSTFGALYRSDDMGNSWIKLPASSSEFIHERIKLAINQNGDLFAYYSSSVYSTGVVYRSKDEGNTWEKVFQSDSSTVFTIVFNSKGHVFIGGTSLYVSVDNGESWEYRSKLHSGYIAINSKDHLISAQDDFLSISTDEGYSWAKIGTIPHDGGIGLIVLNSKDEIFVEARGWEIYKTSDYGDSWQYLMGTYFNTSIAVNSDDDLFVAFFENGIRMSKDDGNTWQIINKGLTNPNVQAMAFDSLNNIYAGTPKGVYRSTNNGENWQTSFIGMNSNTIGSLHSNLKNDLFAVTYSEVYKSSNKGDSWALIYQVLQDTTIINMQIFPNGDIYIMQYDLECQDCGQGDAHVYRSKDNGDTWQDIYFEKDDYIDCINVNENGEIIIKTLSGLHISYDDGETFILQQNNDENYCYDTSVGKDIIWDTAFFDTIYIHDIEIDKYGHFYLATDHGIYYSNNTGNDWNELNEGLEVKEVFDILVDSSGTLYAAPLFGGVWRNMLMVSTKSFKPNTDFSVYPNPSIGIITINLPNKFLSSNTRLDIFNIQGMLVKSIPAMNSKLTIDISDLVPGPYLLNVSGLKDGKVIIVI